MRKGKENEVYKFITDFAIKNGILPTYAEICKGVNLQSTSSVFYYMEYLIEQGLIIKEAGSKYRVTKLRYVLEDG